MSIAFDEAGGLIESTDFPFDEVDQRLNCGRIVPVCEAVDHPNARYDRESLALEACLEWISQKVPKSDNGVIIRANIACWHFLKAWRPMTLTALAAQLGRDKQAVGRWEDDFKVTLARGHWRQRG